MGRPVLPAKDKIQPTQQPTRTPIEWLARQLVSLTVVSIFAILAVAGLESWLFDMGYWPVR